jgi:AraC-like DNA-binding protein/quercetin dioxygenase-like cupin family protein
MVETSRAAILCKTRFPVSRESSMNHREKDISAKASAFSPPVTGRATDYPSGWRIEPHAHASHQLIYAVRGVMVVQAEAGRWVVPPTRAIWMQAGMRHEIRCVGEVHMRSLRVAPDAAPKSVAGTQAVVVSPLLRELIRAAMEVHRPYVANSRDGRLMRLILDELRALPVLPLHLPTLVDPRLVRISTLLQQRPHDPSTMADWARRLSIDPKTIQRLFVKETGLTFGRWRQQARLLRALELLASGEKVIDVALTLGYESPSAFASMFRKQFGQTPSAFFSDG